MSAGKHFPPKKWWERRLVCGLCYLPGAKCLPGFFGLFHSILLWNERSCMLFHRRELDVYQPRELLLVMIAGMTSPGPASGITHSGVYPPPAVPQSLWEGLFHLPCHSNREEFSNYAHSQIDSAFLFLLHVSTEAVSGGRQLCVKSQGKKCYPEDTELPHSHKSSFPQEQTPLTK